MERQMTSAEASRILAKIHKDTYDNTNKIIGECEKIHKDNLKVNRTLEKDFQAYSEEIKDNTLNCSQGILDSVNGNNIETHLKMDSIKNLIIAAIVCFGIIAVFYFYLLDANNKDLTSTIEENKKVTVQIVEAPKQEFDSQSELIDFMNSEEFFKWSNTSISSLDELTRDYTTMYSVLGDRLKVAYVTNDTTANLYGMSMENTISSMSKQFNPDRPHSVKKRITKCFSDIWMNGICHLHAGDYQVEYYDLQ